MNTNSYGYFIRQSPKKEHLIVVEVYSIRENQYTLIAEYFCIDLTTALDYINMIQGSQIILSNVS